MPERDEEPPKLALDETMELLTKVLGAATLTLEALKMKLGLCELKKFTANLSSGVGLLTRSVKSCGGIYNKYLDSCPSLFHPRVRTIVVCSVAEIPVEKMGGFGLASTFFCCIAVPLQGGTKGASTVLQVQFNPENGTACPTADA